MSSLKRKNPAPLLERRVRPRKDEDSDIEEVDDFSDARSSESEEGDSDGSGGSESEDASEKGEQVSHITQPKPGTNTDSVNRTQKKNPQMKKKGNQIPS